MAHNFKYLVGLKINDTITFIKHIKTQADDFKEIPDEIQTNIINALDTEKDLFDSLPPLIISIKPDISDDKAKTLMDRLTTLRDFLDTFIDNNNTNHKLFIETSKSVGFQQYANGNFEFNRRNSSFVITDEVYPNSLFNYSGKPSIKDFTSAMAQGKRLDVINYVKAFNATLYNPIEYDEDAVFDTDDKTDTRIDDEARRSYPALFHDDNFRYEENPGTPGKTPGKTPKKQPLVFTGEVAIIEQFSFKTKVEEDGDGEGNGDDEGGDDEEDGEEKGGDDEGEDDKEDKDDKDGGLPPQQKNAEGIYTPPSSPRANGQEGGAELESVKPLVIESPTFVNELYDVGTKAAPVLEKSTTVHRNLRSRITKIKEQWQDKQAEITPFAETSYAVSLRCLLIDATIFYGELMTDYGDILMFENRQEIDFVEHMAESPVKGGKRSSRKKRRTIS
jgi:hypothetical protein